MLVVAKLGTSWAPSPALLIVYVSKPFPFFLNFTRRGELRSPTLSVGILREEILSVLFEQGAAKEEIFATQIICFAN